MNNYNAMPVLKCQSQNRDQYCATKLHMYVFAIHFEQPPPSLTTLNILRNVVLEELSR